jgi:uncharacterized membrane protein
MATPLAGDGASGQHVRPPDERLLAAIRGLLLLLGEAVSLSLALGLASLGPAAMARFVSGNELPPEARALLLRVMGCGGGVALLVGALLWRSRGAAAVWEASRRLAPGLLAALLPPLLNWRAWEGRELHFLVTAGLLVLGIRALVPVALSARPIGVPWPRPLGAPSLSLGIVCVAALGYIVYFGHHTIAHHRNLGSQSFDLGLENNALWNLVHGGPFLKSSPFSGPEGSLLGYHAIFFAYVLAPLYALHQDPETLLAVQALLIGTAALPLFLWGRAYVGEAAAATCALCYLLYPPLHGANLYDFHYVAIAPSFLWATLWALEARRDRLAAIGAALCLLLREDVAASLAVVGLYLLLSGRRPRAGALVAAASALYFVAVKFVVMPAAEPDPSFLYAWAGLLPAGERSFAAVLKTVAGNPVYALGTLLTLPKLVYVLHLMVPLAFLPLRRPLGLLFILPGTFFTLLSTGYAPFTRISFQYTSHWTSFLFPALALALCRPGRSPCPDPLPPGARKAALAALVAGTFVCSHQYGAVLQGHTARAGFDPFRFGTTDLDRARRRELQDLIAAVPPRAKVAASETVVPHVSSRPDAYTLRLGVYDAEYLLFSLVPTAAGEVERAREALADGRFGVVVTGSHFVLARRGHDTAGNAAVLEHLAHFVPAAPP